MSAAAVAASSRIAAEAGTRIAAEGGNAVDVAVASMLVSLTTEPSICALGGGGFVTVWPRGDRPVVIDGYVEMPGRGLPPEALGRGGLEVHVGYGGGVTTTVGYGSVGTPGALAALGLASQRFGILPWRRLVEPAWEWARDGFPLPAAAHRYLRHSHELVYGWHPESRAALHDASGRLKELGESVRIPSLADSLRLIADQGPRVFYEGELGDAIADHVQENGGVLTRADMRAYRPLVRAPLDVTIDRWHLASNPPPAIGGGVLAAMLTLMEGRPRDGWTREETAHLIRVQEAVLGFRLQHVDLSENLEADMTRLVNQASWGELRRRVASPSTVHCSAVDDGGLACSVSVSTGYGSGVMPPNTGIWLNNCLGEQELNRRGFHSWAPGTRLASNMAPSIARASDGATLAVGSPGAERIPTAIQQTLLNFIRLGMPLADAIAHPRLHVELPAGELRVAYEPGMPVDELEVPQRRFDELSMFFGGVAAALWEPGRGFSVASDPRREGGASTHSASHATPRGP